MPKVRKPHFENDYSLKVASQKCIPIASQKQGILEIQPDF